MRSQRTTPFAAVQPHSTSAFVQDNRGELDEEKSGAQRGGRFGYGYIRGEVAMAKSKWLWRLTRNLVKRSKNGDGAIVANSVTAPPVVALRRTGCLE